jgi:hypothetical protein
MGWGAAAAIVIIGALLCAVGWVLKGKFGGCVAAFGVALCYVGQVIGGFAVIVAAITGVVGLLQHLQVL